MFLARLAAGRLDDLRCEDLSRQPGIRRPSHESLLERALGPTLDQAGALIELTQGGKAPVTLPNGETRTFLEDGDTVTLRGWCEKLGAARIGFGECIGTVLPPLN